MWSYAILVGHAGIAIAAVLRLIYPSQGSCTTILDVLAAFISNMLQMEVAESLPIIIFY